MERSGSDIEGRIERWIKACGPVWGGGRANPDNDMYFLMRDALKEIRRLKKGKKVMELKKADFLEMLSQGGFKCVVESTVQEKNKMTDKDINEALNVIKDKFEREKALLQDGPVLDPLTLAQRYKDIFDKSYTSLLDLLIKATEDAE